MAMKSIKLNVITPERPVVSDQVVDEMVLPGADGQLTIRPGHINFLSSLKHGIFGYRIKEDWNIAFLEGGFIQIFQDEAIILAETLEMSQELDLAKAEAEEQDILALLKATKPQAPEFIELQKKLQLTKARIQAARKKIR